MWSGPAGATLPPLVTAFNTVTDQLFVLLGDAVNRMRTAYQNNPYLARVLGEAVAGAARTNTFLGERYRRLARRRGKNKAIVSVGRSLLVIIWHLLANPDTDFIDLGVGYHDTRASTQRAIRNHIRHLQALGYTVTLHPAA